MQSVPSFLPSPSLIALRLSFRAKTLSDRKAEDERDGGRTEGERCSFCVAVLQLLCGSFDTTAVWSVCGRPRKV